MQEEPGFHPQHWSLDLLWPVMVPIIHSQSIPSQHQEALLLTAESLSSRKRKVKERKDSGAVTPLRSVPEKQSQDRLCMGLHSLPLQG